MVCNCCIRIIKQELSKLPLKIEYISLGEIHIEYSESEISRAEIDAVFEREGFPVLEDKEKILVEQLKTAVIELIHLNNNKSSIIRNSDYLVEKLGTSYHILSRLFSKHEKITLERFIILHKIEKVKELLDYDELSLSEIAYDMGYSSVQYLSNVFKGVTGKSVTEYKKNPVPRKSIDDVGDS